MAAGSPTSTVEQRQGVVNALFEDRVGELPVTKRTRELHRPHQQREQAECLRVCGLRIFRREKACEVVGDVEHAVGVGTLGVVGGSTDLIQQGGGRAAVGGVVPVLDGEVFA